jgi:hypothetical protein
MTVCIASMCGAEPDEPKRIVAVADMKASSPQGSNEAASTKSKWIAQQWLALFAGNDISPCLPICRAVEQGFKEAKENTVEKMTALFAAAYKSCLSGLAADIVLGRWKLSMENFLESGRKNFGPDVFDNLCSQIEQVRLQCQFLVSGFDKYEQPHLFTVSNPGIAENRDTPGYYAIGDGSSAAMSILGFFKQNKVTTLARTYYNVLAGKYMAESSASTVGYTTFLWEIGSNGQQLETPKQVTDLLLMTRLVWESRGQPSVPDGVEKSIKSLRFPSPPSESQKS